ncbi:MAG: small multi-drug export protein [Clostridia bacterium]|nr:small multi-drug export protein [Clostridia bacterium]
MVDSLVRSIVDTFGGTVPSQLIVFVVSMIPILELRGSILAAGFMDVSFLQTYIVAVLGNLLPIPFILLFITKILEWMKTTKSLGKLAVKLENKALSKREQIDKYGAFGLFLFVAIPLPGTGAWTGSLLAALLHMKPWKAFLSIALGVMAAGLVMSLLAFGIIKNIF